MTPPINLDQPIQVLVDGLTEEQRARTMAAACARAMLTGQKFGGRVPPDASDLIRLADWIITGESEPLYPYSEPDGTVHLGPNVLMKPDGYIWVNGEPYEPASDDGHDEDSQGPENFTVIGGTDG
jgi:hypothetical protein